MEYLIHNLYPPQIQYMLTTEDNPKQHLLHFHADALSEALQILSPLSLVRVVLSWLADDCSRTGS